MTTWVLLISVGLFVLFAIVVKRKGTSGTENQTSSLPSSESISAARLEYEHLEASFRLINIGEYISQSLVREWLIDLSDSVELARGPDIAELLPDEMRPSYTRIRSAFSDLGEFAKKYNNEFIPRRIKEDQEWFDTIEAYPLTSRQREAVVTDEDTTLIVAGAGTGKTSVIIAKADYLIRHGLARPNEILLLTFNRSAAVEIAERLDKRGVPAGTTVSTFHSFGKSVVTDATQKSPRLSELADQSKQTSIQSDESDDESIPDRRALKQFVGELLHSMLADAETAQDVVDLFTTHLDETPADPTSSGKSNEEMIAELQALGTVDLTGTRLKSRQEVKIANWLTLNGIRWEYERPYPIETTTARYRQYQPDFYLPDYDLYLEHFGINRAGVPAPWIDASSYRKSMEWKRSCHIEGGTILVEIFSYDDTEGALITRLEAKLRALGVEPRRLSREELSIILHGTNVEYGRLVDLICQFLSVFKGGGSERREVQSRARGARDLLFLRTFFHVFDAYELKLRDDQTIDFDDMINLARGYLETGTTQSPYKYIIVDEFQDISLNRLRLLQAARSQVSRGRLFAVGDDWQSIYRFTGSDVSLVTHLSEWTGAMARVDLDTSFRYPQAILDVTSEFIMTSPQQLRKSIRSHSRASDVRPILVISGQPRDESQESLRIALADIAQQSEELLEKDPKKRVEVLIIGRYRHTKPKHIGVAHIAVDEQGNDVTVPAATFQQVANLLKRDRIDLTYLTAHRSKGKEADFVIILEVNNGRLGFPSTVSDDPVMELVLSTPDDFPHAEERRLFYVAMTRAKRRIYITTSSSHPSVFLDGDLLKSKYRAHIEQVGPMVERHRCPDCNGITILRRNGKYGFYWGCTNFPHCAGRLELCSACKSGCMVKSESDASTFHCSECDNLARGCPRCGKGILVVRKGKNGSFEGCSSWNGGIGCNFTRDIRPTANALFEPPN